MAAENLTNQTEYLLIGGSSDGVRVKDFHHSLILLKRKDSKLRFTIDFQDELFEREYYRLTKFVDNDNKIHYVYVHEDCRNPLQLLVEKYPNPKV